MPGVPASEIRAQLSPRASLSRIESALPLSLKEWYATRGLVIPKRRSSGREVRVSSQAMKSASDSTRAALAVMSSRLPTGVGTM